MFCRACTKKQRFYTWWENSSLHWCFIIEDTSFVLTHRCSGWVSRKQRRLLKTLLAVSNWTCLFYFESKMGFFLQITILSVALFRSWRRKDWAKGRCVAFTARWGECLRHLSRLGHFCGFLNILILFLWFILNVLGRGNNLLLLLTIWCRRRKRRLRKLQRIKIQQENRWKNFTLTGNIWKACSKIKVLLYHLTCRYFYIILLIYFTLNLFFFRFGEK